MNQLEVPLLYQKLYPRDSESQTMTRVMLATFDLLTPFDLRSQISRVNAEFPAYYHGDTEIKNSPNCNPKIDFRKFRCIQAFVTSISVTHHMLRPYDIGHIILSLMGFCHLDEFYFRG